MLVLTRGPGEEIIIDGRIRIKILAIEGEQARFEVNFPECVSSDGNDPEGQEDETSS